VSDESIAQRLEDAYNARQTAKLAEEKAKYDAYIERINKTYEGLGLERKEKIKEMKQILKSLGVVMSVSGCGCCGSPIVEFGYCDDTGYEFFTGELDYADFDTQEE
jgi:hypothetical protein